jgi:RNA polymerase sigma-70 factor (ECF subfamily)
MLGPDGRHHAQSIHVLTVAGGLVAGIVAFLDTGLFPSFGLPTVLDTAAR